MTLRRNPIWKLLFLITSPPSTFTSPLLSISPYLFTFGYNLSVFLYFLPPSLHLTQISPFPSHCSLMSICQSFTASFNPMFPPSSPLFLSHPNLAILQCLPLSQSLLSYLSPLHSWLNTFSSPSSVFLFAHNLSSFISIFHSFTVGYIFPTLLFFLLRRLS